MIHFLFSVACTDGGVGDQLTDKSGIDTAGTAGDDVTAPVIDFVPPETNLPSGQDVVLDASISDVGTGVLTAELFFRNETDGSKDWKSVGFLPIGSDLWQATIQADEQRSGGMWYYIRAVDHALNEGYFPEDGDVEPLHFGFTD